MKHKQVNAEARLPDWLVQNRNFLLLWAAYGISAVGDHLSEQALLVERHALESEHSTRIQALLSFGFFLPFVLFGPVAGWCADRFNRKWTMILADCIRAAIVLNAGLIVVHLASSMDAAGLADYSVLGPTLLLGLFAAFFSPCRQAMLPTLVREDQIVRANAMISALGTIGTILSAVLGGFIVKHYGTTASYRLDALTYLLSAVLLFGIVTRQTRLIPTGPARGLLAPVRDGFTYVSRHRRTFQLILIASVFWACAGVIVSVIPAIVRDVFGGDIADVGVYRGLIAIGLAGGAVVMTILGNALPIPFALWGAALGGGFWILMLNVAYTLELGRIATGVCLVVIGGHGAALLVTIMATLQRTVPNSWRGRVFGVSDMLTMGAMVLASGLLGLPNIPDIDRYVPLLLNVAAALLLLTSWRIWARYRRGRREYASVTILWWLVRAYAYWWCRARRTRPCTIPLNGPVIVAANHTAGIDPIMLQAMSLNRVISFIVAKEYYQKPIAGWVMRQVHCLPVDRRNPGRAFFSETLRFLKGGGCLGMFPQGTFERPDAEVPGPKHGIGMIALRTGATVVPAHISGTKYFDNPFRAFFSRHQVRVAWGQPIDLSAFAGREKDKSAPEEIAALIMRRINELAPPKPEAP